MDSIIPREHAGRTLAALLPPAELNPKSVPVRVAGTPDNPLFCLADVCQVLEIGNPRNVADRLDDDEKGVRQADTPGGQQNMTFVTEGGLYTVLLRSDKPQAKPFRKWVTGEVLPTLRKYGCYPAPAEDRAGRRSLLALREVLDRMIDLEDRQHAQVEQIQATQAQAAHAEVVANAAMTCVASAHGYYTALGFLKIIGVQQPGLAVARALGVRASSLCRARGTLMQSARDPRFGTVHSYPEEVLSEAWEQIRESWAL